ncbi:MAG: hypothetical protein K8U57_11860 [Planctomycetes bacterium]|nr:hypothetical protein [Planctomycetota bacterium]
MIREKEEPAKSNKILLLSLAGFVAVCVLGLGALLASRLANTPAEWRVYNSPGGGFSVDLPAAPVPDVAKKLGLPDAPGLVAEGTALRRGHYVVIWGPIQQRWRTDEQIIEDSHQGSLASGKATNVVKGEPFAVSGFLARDLELTMSDGTSGLIRAVVADSRLYILAVGGRGVDPRGEEVQRFLSSFKITDQNLIEVGKVKEKERQREAERLKQYQARRAEEERERAVRDAAWNENERKRREDSDKMLAEHKLAQEKARLAAAATNAAFIIPPTGITAPDPTTLPDLKVYISFDKEDRGTTPIWPKGEAMLPGLAVTRPGLRGNAAYLGSRTEGIRFPIELLPTTAVNGSITAAGWVKVQRDWGVEIIRLLGTRRDRALFSTGLQRSRYHLPLHAFAQLNTNRGKDWKAFPGESVPGTISAKCPEEEAWHHVAVSRDVKSRNQATLYLDGELVAAYEVEPGAQQSVLELAVGLPVHSPLLPPQSFGTEEPQKSPLVAIDEVCVFDRALAAHEIRYLAGKTKSPTPANDLAVRLGFHASLRHLAGVAFDVERKTMWAVSAVDTYWDSSSRNGTVRAASPQLIRYSYPDFKPTGVWSLPVQTFNQDTYHGVASAPLLDLKNNRLFVTMNYGTGPPTEIQREADWKGPFYRFDLDELSDAPKGLASLKPAAQMKGSGSASFDDAVVSPDGQWLYYIDTSAGKKGVAVCRVGVDLASPENVESPGWVAWDTKLWLTPDGKTLRAVKPERGNSSFPEERIRILDIDTATWKGVAVREASGIKWNTSKTFPPTAVHPDGRTFVGGRAGILEITATAPMTTRLRPVSLPPISFLRISADGRYLFAAEADGKQNRLFVLDVRPNASQLGALATLDGEQGKFLGGPFTVAPDGKFVVFRSGLIVRLDEGADLLKVDPKK